VLWGGQFLAFEDYSASSPRRVLEPWGWRHNEPLTITSQETSVLWL